MKAKDYLRQYEELNRRAERLRKEYETELDKIDAIGSTLSGDGIPHGSGVSRKTEDKAIRLADKAMAWKVAELDTISARQEVFEMIQNVPGKEGEILYERYINLRHWKDICKIVNYSWNGVHTAHRRALAIVQEQLDKQGTHGYTNV